jgi:hypothetical protein
MRTSRLVAEIDKAITNGQIHQPFRASDVRRTCPDFAYRTYYSFLTEHAWNNPNNKNAYFEKVERGLYRRLRDS